jgi:predicted transcriptional regulator
MAVLCPSTVNATFTFDEATIRRLDEASVRLARPKGQIVREAIQEYYSRMDRLSDQERDSMLREFDELAPAIPARLGRFISRGERLAVPSFFGFNDEEFIARPDGSAVTDCYRGH